MGVRRWRGRDHPSPAGSGRPEGGAKVLSSGRYPGRIPHVGLQANTPALAPLRGKDPLSGWVNLFARRDPSRAERYREALALFLGHSGPKGSDWGQWAYVRRSPSTLRAYRFAVVEFFEFLARFKGKVIAPHEVTRRDAFEYAEWLSNRGEGRWDFSLEAEKLKDGDREDDLAIYQSLKKLGTANIADIARALPHKLRQAHPAAEVQIATKIVDELWLENRLLGLMRDEVITRSPTLDEIRREYPRAGFDDRVDPLVYEYTCVPVKPVARATIALRLSALSSFWQVMQKGENAADKQRALLDYNVFDDALKAVTKNLTAAKRTASMSKRPTAELVGRIFAAAEGPRLVDKRNVALLWFLLLMGTRISEALNARRAEPPTETDRLKYPGWLDRSSDPVTVVLRRKGGQDGVLAMPSYVLAALTAFWSHMAELAEGAEPRDPHYRYRLLLREADAPLFPPVGMWGFNQLSEESEHGLWSYRKALTRQGVQKMLARLSTQAGLSDAEKRRIHPHGFRHLFGEAGAAEADIRTVQLAMGHSQITTTEGYLPTQMRDVQRSLQSEVLDYLAKHGFQAPGQPKPADKPPEPPTRTITTYGREAPAKARQELLRAARLPPKAGEMPTAPEAPLALLPPAPVQPAGTPLVAVGHEVSPEGPIDVYEAMAAGKKPPDLTWSAAPQSKWIQANYPDLPVGFGMGKKSLLPWWQKDAPQPWPVLAPAQAYPELCPELGFLRQLERIYDEWSTTKPSATLALAQWLYFLGSLTVFLEQRIAGTHSWVTFTAKATVGEDIRAHMESWLVAWFERNAHTFTTVARKFAAAITERPGEPGDIGREQLYPGKDESERAFWRRVLGDPAIQAAMLMPGVPQLPDYYFEPDPVHAIYERDRQEWKAFVAWIGKLTGTTSSDVRTESKDEQLSFFESGEQGERARAEAFIREFYSIVDEIREPTRDYSKAEQKSLERQRETYRDFIKREFNVSLPRKVAEEDRGKREQRVRTLLNRAFDGEPDEIRNVLGDSRMFGKDAFRIDKSGHTISHTELFRERFAQRFGDRDSECVMRRIARALWERARVWEAAERKMTAAEQKRELFITLLAQLAFVVPCPPDIEQRLVARGVSYARPSEVAQLVNERIRGLAEDPEADFDESDVVDATAAEVLDIFEAAQEPPARAARPRIVENPGELLRNADAATPHPLRLVVASFWPV